MYVATAVIRLRDIHLLPKDSDLSNLIKSLGWQMLHYQFVSQKWKLFMTQPDVLTTEEKDRVIYGTIQYIFNSPTSA